MPKHLWILLITGIVQPLAIAADVSEYSCEYDLKQRFGTFGMARIQLKDGEIQAIDHMNRDVAGSGRYAFGCWVDKKRNEKRSDEQQVWQDKANTTIIKTEYPAEYSKESDSLTIVQTAEGYFLDMGKLGGHPYCGAGAELPRAVFISKASKRCKVRMR